MVGEPGSGKSQILRIVAKLLTLELTIKIKWIINIWNKPY